MSVEKGWQNSSEVNRVIFNPEKIDVNRLEVILRESGTYIRTVPQQDNPRKASDTRDNVPGTIRGGEK